MTLVEQLRAWEANMTREEMEAAFDFLAGYGWHRGDTPPPYVWAAAYRAVAPDKIPQRPTQH